ncbi:MAG: hypothetical protein ABI361_08535 [Nitrososphaera sp.]|jgi:hypothetical protein
MFCIDRGIAKEEIVSRFEGDWPLVDIWTSFLIHKRWLEPDMSGKLAITDKARKWLMDHQDMTMASKCAGLVVSDGKVVKRLRETIEFLKVESDGGVWNTPQIIAMLEDLFKTESELRRSIGR